ncbi:MAG: hypothetical protein R2762_24980 [Bryobacteraceae bacterium]
MLFLAMLAMLAADAPRRLDNPAYVPSSLVNAASSESGAVAPNTIVTLYGQGLAYGVRALRDSDIRANQLPTVLTGSGVRVYVANMPAAIYYVSPTQVNLLLPADLPAGPARLRLALDGRSGPEVPIVLRPAAPALFQMEGRVAIATRPDGSLITAERRARPGETIVLYATGLGELSPPLPPGQLARTAAWIARAGEFRLWIDGASVPREAILYAGAAPGFAGLYQINLVLPSLVGARPTIRIAVGDDASPADVVVEAAP